LTFVGRHLLNELQSLFDLQEAQPGPGGEVTHLTMVQA
jgi:hypothetical protein